MNKSKVSVIVLLVVIIIIAVISSKLSNKQIGSSEEIVKIGGAFALTGDVAVYGEADRDGAQLAIDEINAAGGINGKQLKLIVEDTRSTARDTVTAFTKLKNIDKADYFLVSFADSYPGTESLVDKDEMLISPDGSPEVMNGTVMHDTVFGTWYRTQPKSELAVRHMAETGKKKIYVIANNDAYFSMVVDYTKEAAKKYGLEVVGVDLMGNNADIRSLLPKVKASGADALFFSTMDQGIYTDFLKHHKSMLKDVAIYTDEVATSYLGPESVGNMENVFFYTNVEPSTKFLEAFKAKFGHEPQITASVSYDSANMIAQVIKDSPSDIASYMRSHTFDTVSYGKVTIDAIGGIQSDAKYFVMKQVKNGKAVEVFK